MFHQARTRIGVPSLHPIGAELTKKVDQNIGINISKSDLGVWCLEDMPARQSEKYSVYHSVSVLLDMCNWSQETWVSK